VDQLDRHKLRREIIATQVANKLINLMGPTFIQRMIDATGASSPDIAKAFFIAKDVFGMEQLWEAIEKLDFHVGAQDQMDMMLGLMRLVRRGTRWFLRNRRCELDVSTVTERFSPGVHQVSNELPSLLVGARLKQWEKNRAYYMAQGFPAELADVAAGANSMLPVLGIVEAAEIANRPVKEVAQYYFSLGDRLELFWFAQEIDNLPVDNHWQALAREAFRDDLDWQQRSLTVSVLQLGLDDMDVGEQVDHWCKEFEFMVHRWKSMIFELRSAQHQEFSMYSVALRELMDLAQLASRKL